MEKEEGAYQGECGMEIPRTKVSVDIRGSKEQRKEKAHIGKPLESRARREEIVFQLSVIVHLATSVLQNDGKDDKDDDKDDDNDDEDDGAIFTQCRKPGLTQLPRRGCQM